MKRLRHRISKGCHLERHPIPRASSILSALQGQPGAPLPLLQLLTDAYVHWLVTESLSPCPLLSAPEPMHNEEVQLSLPAILMCLQSVKATQVTAPL